MTAVIGLLNKRGVAIAADSAVTITQGTNEKYTKNGSKMLRISNIEPISIMITGNAAFLYNPWEVIVRRYRQLRGDIKHPTVEACVYDFFDFISENEVFWDNDCIIHFLTNILARVFNKVKDSVSKKLRIKYLNDPKKHVNAFVKELKILQKKYTQNERCSHFRDYSIEQFRVYAKPVVDDYFEELIENENNNFDFSFPTDYLDNIREELELAVMNILTNCNNKFNFSSILIFSGFGEEQIYPSLIPAVVNEGFDSRVSYYINPEDIVCISDEKPVAICPFAQKDVIYSLIRGENYSWLGHIMDYTREQYQNVDETIFSEKYNEQDMEFLNMLIEVEYEDLVYRYGKNIMRLLNKNQKEWEKRLEHYDLKAMAALAESLIDLTGFQRILTFRQEGVGGPVDVAVITKNDGFTWLNRKSWYHHKDVNGMYGSLGI